MLDGNHSWKLWTHGNYAQMIAKDLGVPYGTWTVRMTVSNMKDKLMYRSYHTHGSRAINSYADDISRRVDNMNLILKRHLQDQSGDTVLLTKAHTHKLLISRPTKRLYIIDDGTETKQAYTKADHTAEWIHPDHRWYVNTGSFLKLFGKGISGYAERAEYKPIELGYAIVEVRDGEIQDIKKVTV